MYVISRELARVNNTIRAIMLVFDFIYLIQRHIFNELKN